MIISNFPCGGGNKKPPEKAFVDCTWEEVSAICKAGLAPEYWAIGDKKPMVAGATTKVLRIIDFDHDDVADQTAYGRAKAGVTLELVDAQSTVQGAMNDKNYLGTVWYSTTDVYHCRYRKTVLPQFLSAEIPTDLKNVLVPVKKEYHTVSGESAIVSDTLFLLSVNEIVGGYISGDGSEGERYSYYTAGNSIRRNVAYWTRSNVADKAEFYYIDANGKVEAATVISYTPDYGFPAMCI